MPASQRGRRLSNVRFAGPVRAAAMCAAMLAMASGTAVSLGQDSKTPTQPERRQPVTRPVIPTPPRPGSNQPPGAGNPNPAAGQPGSTRGGEMIQQLKPPEAGLKDDDRYQFGPYSEPIELTQIIDLIRQDFDLELLYTDSGLKGQTVVINTAVTLPQDQVLPFVLTLLDQKDYTIVRDASGVHMVQPKNTIQANPGTGLLSPTKIIRTPGLKPSSLQGLITNLISRGGGQASTPVYLDDLGIIVMTDTPRNTRLVEEAVGTVLKERGDQKFLRFEIHNIAASSARDRIFELLGSGVARGAVGAQGAGAGQQAAAGLAGVLTNLPERLSVDPGSNALFFRGREDEGQLLADLLSLVDVPITLVSRFYNTGSETAETVATEGSRQLLGEVTTFESSSGSVGSRSSLGAGRVPAGGGQAGQGQQPALGGSGFVIYPSAGGFIYRGTEAQHARVQALVVELGDLIDNDTPITMFYKLKHQKAEDVAETINSLLSGQAPSSSRNSPLIGGDLGSNRRDPFNRQRNTPRPADQPAAQADAAGAAGDEAVGDLSSDEVFVLADEKNNQVLVKAPKRLQPQMRSLISQLDLLRPQVYIEAKIVTITVGDDLRFASEVQQIIGQFALNTNFGLSTLDSLLERKEPAANLAGVTTALIRSKDVPFIINAIQRNNEARVVATPQLLVDDNEEAEVSSLDQQPTSTVSIGSPGQPNSTGFGGYEPAGPKMRIKPQVSDGGSVKLEYEIEISSFTGDASGDGSPPPKREDKVRADSVTVPSDSTIVVGGLVFESVTEADAGIPILKDIPGIGLLFKDIRKTSRKTLLYVFVTPRVMRDTSFNDLRILTQGPMSASKLDPEVPAAEPLRMEVLDQNLRREPAPDEASLRKSPPARRDPWPAE